MRNKDMKERRENNDNQTEGGTQTCNLTNDLPYSN